MRPAFEAIRLKRLRHPSGESEQSAGARKPPSNIAGDPTEPTDETPWWLNANPWQQKTYESHEHRSTTWHTCDHVWRNKSSKCASFAQTLHDGVGTEFSLGDVSRLARRMDEIIHQSGGLYPSLCATQEVEMRLTHTRWISYKPTDTCFRNVQTTWAKC